ncbi:hypothetical protein P7K49_017211, partial [Saguinus oedipus]
MPVMIASSLLMNSSNAAICLGKEESPWRSSRPGVCMVYVKRKSLGGGSVPWWVASGARLAGSRVNVVVENEVLLTEYTFKAAGQQFLGILNVNKRRAQIEDFVRLQGASSKDSDLVSDIPIYGTKDQNRSIHGDVVVVELLPKNEWKERTAALCENDSDDKALGESPSEPMPTGGQSRVVGILQKNWWDYVVTFPSKEEVQSQGKNAQKILDFRVVVRIDSWESTSVHPNGHFVHVLGRIRDLEGEIATILVENNNRDMSMMMSEMDVHAIADRLKLYFRELPEPLFTDKFYPISMRASVSTGGLGVIGGQACLPDPHLEDLVYQPEVPLQSLGLHYSGLPSGVGGSCSFPRAALPMSHCSHTTSCCCSPGAADPCEAEKRDSGGSYPTLVPFTGSSLGPSAVGVRMMMSLGCSETCVLCAPCHKLGRGLQLIVTMRSNPLPSAVISDPTAKENSMLHLPLSQLEANLLTFLFLLDHLK